MTEPQCLATPGLAKSYRVHAEGVIQVSLTGTSHLPRKSVPVLSHPHGKEIVPHAHPEPPRHSPVPLPCIPSLVTRQQRLQF